MTVFWIGFAFGVPAGALLCLASMWIWSKP